MMLDMVDIRTSRHKVVLLFSHNEDHFYAGDDGYYDNVSRFEALSGSEAVLEVCVFCYAITWSIYHYHYNHRYGDHFPNN